MDLPSRIFCCFFFFFLIFMLWKQTSECKMWWKKKKNSQKILILNIWLTDNWKEFLQSPITVTVYIYQDIYILLINIYWRHLKELPHPGDGDLRKLSQNCAHCTVRLSIMNNCVWYARNIHVQLTCTIWNSDNTYIKVLKSK